MKAGAIRGPLHRRRALAAAGVSHRASQARRTLRRRGDVIEGGNEGLQTSVGERRLEVVEETLTGDLIAIGEGGGAVIEEVGGEINSTMTRGEEGKCHLIMVEQRRVPVLLNLVLGSDPKRWLDLSP